MASRLQQRWLLRKGFAAVVIGVSKPAAAMRRMEIDEERQVHEVDSDVKGETALTQLTATWRQIGRLRTLLFFFSSLHPDGV